MLASAAKVYLKNHHLQSEASLGLFLGFDFGSGPGSNSSWALDGLNICCQHPVSDIHDASAGCLIGRLWEEHLDFMARVKNDRRYLFDSGFIFPTTIIDRTKLR